MKNNKKIIFSVIIITSIMVFILIINFNLSNREYIVETNDLLQEDKVINSETSENIFDSDTAESVTVYISGEVLDQKVVKVEQGKRLIDAVELCGGFTDKADLNLVNLALVLEEEGHYIIPKIGENYTQATSDSKQTNTSSELVNINTADINILKTLPGVGDILAQRILEKRELLGKFESIEQLRDVSGIGDKKYSDIKDKVIIK